MLTTWWSFGPKIEEIHPQHLAGRMKLGETPLVIDVREPVEYSQGHIPGSRLIPLGTLAQRLDEVSREQEVVMVCRSGRRSRQACQVLLRNGFKKVKNLKGGMEAWEGNVE